MMATFSRRASGPHGPECSRSTTSLPFFGHSPSSERRQIGSVRRLPNTGQNDGKPWRRAIARPTGFGHHRGQSPPQPKRLDPAVPPLPGERVALHQLPNSGGDAVRGAPSQLGRGSPARSGTIFYGIQSGRLFG